MLRLGPRSLLSVLRWISVAAAILVLVLPKVSIAGDPHHDGHPELSVVANMEVQAELCLGEGHFASGFSSEACCGLACHLSLPGSAPELGPSSALAGRIELGPERKSGVEPDSVRRPPKLVAERAPLCAPQLSDTIL